MISKRELIDKQVRIAKLDYEWTLYGAVSVPPEGLREDVDRVIRDAEELCAEVIRLHEVLGQVVDTHEEVQRFRQSFNKPESNLENES